MHKATHGTRARLCDSCRLLRGVISLSSACRRGLRAGSMTDRFHFVGSAHISQYFCERFVESIRPQQWCADASLATFEHWQPQTAALDDCGKKQSGGRSYQPVQQREGRSVRQPVLAEHMIELCTGNQTASIPIRRREMASAASLVEPK